MSGVVRDSRADEAFLTRAIARAEADIASDEKRLERPAEKWQKPRYLATAAGHAVKPHWELFSVRYSAGASAEMLRGVFDGLLVASERACRLEKELFSEDLVQLQFRNVRIKDYYLEWLQLVSLAIAFEVDDAVFDRVVVAVEFGWGDRLIDRLIASRRPGHPVGDELLFPKLSGVLDEAFTASDPARVVKRYLAKWYTTWKGIVGWGDHEVIPKLGYYGYWAFEVLGVMKVLGIDDASFRDDVYYPRDLAAL